MNSADLLPDEKALLNIEDVTADEVEQLLRIMDQAQDFQELMMKYDCAMSEVRTKLEVLNKELALRNNRNPFESIKSRIKTPVSIYRKMQSRHIDFSVKNIEENLSDIAGIRVICSFMDDIYMLADCLKKQDDIELVEEKDYIENPKPSGYRSLHLIIRVPIFLTHEKQYMKVEVQFRTIAMDFWASLEHKMKYKKNIEDAEIITDDLKFSADLINQLDRRMQQIRTKIDSGKVIGGEKAYATDTDSFIEKAKLKLERVNESLEERKAIGKDASGRTGAADDSGATADDSGAAAYGSADGGTDAASYGSADAGTDDAFFGKDNASGEEDSTINEIENNASREGMVISRFPSRKKEAETKTKKESVKSGTKTET